MSRMVAVTSAYESVRSISLVSTVTTEHLTAVTAPLEALLAQVAKLAAPSLASLSFRCPWRIPESVRCTLRSCLCRSLCQPTTASVPPYILRSAVVTAVISLSSSGVSLLVVKAYSTGVT